MFFLLILFFFPSALLLPLFPTSSFSYDKGLKHCQSLLHIVRNEIVLVLLVHEDTHVRPRACVCVRVCVCVCV